MMVEEKLSLEACLKAASETDALVINENAFREIPSLLKKHFDAGTAGMVCIIADENTYKAAGGRIREILEDAGIPLAAPFIFPGLPRLHADYRHIAAINAHIKALPECEKTVPLSVGAGTVNDLVKRAAGELGLPYFSFAVAASVDGYTSYGAALLADGFKQTFPCAAPRVVAADTAVLKEAPAFLSSSGFGDLAGKIIAGTDWIIADMAGNWNAPGAESIDGKAWAMTQAGLWDTLEASAGAVRGDGDAINTLFTALAITGFAMQYLRSSRPVSGCEHLVSHIWEMEDLCVDGAPVTHGHKVALGTLAATAFTETFFSRAAAPDAAPGWKRPGPAEREAEVRGAFSQMPGGSNGKAADAAVKTAAEKLPDEKAAASFADAARDNWKTLREKVLERLPPYEKLKGLMQRGGCPIKPEAFNLNRGAVLGAIRKAQMIRNRYTVLDLAWDLGVFEETLAEMELLEAYW
jgi:glycerol-1-phosphate dehydrogenase [NAD(P)+]